MKAGEFVQFRFDLTKVLANYQDCLWNYSVQCFLLTPDKSKRTTIDGLAGWFSIKNEKGNNTLVDVEELPAQLKPKFNKPEVVFYYEDDVNKAAYIEQLINEGILESFP